MNLAAGPAITMARGTWISYLVCAAFLLGCGSIYGLETMAPAHTGSAYIAVHVFLTLMMLAAWRWGGASHMQLILFTGIAARLLLIPAPMLSSNDAERYLWDGAVALAGFDPYSVPPENPAVAGLRAIWATPPEHAAYPTLYPPAALSLFALSALAGPVWGIWAWKFIVGGAGIILLLLARALLRRRGLERHFALVALSPLLLLEIGVGAHLDGIVALTIVGALLAFDRGRMAWTGALLGLGICLKLLPAALLFALALAAGWRGAMRMGTAAIAAVFVIYAAALTAGWRPVGSLPVFFEKWRNGSPLFTLFESYLPLQTMLILIGVLALLAAGLIVILARRQTTVAAQIALAAPLLLSPVAFPWYLCVLVPLAALAPSASLLIWLSASPLIYEVRDRFVSEGVWMPASWPLMVIGAGWAIGVIVDMLRARKIRSAKGHSVNKDQSVPSYLSSR